MARVDAKKIGENIFSILTDGEKTFLVYLLQKKGTVRLHEAETLLQIAGYDATPYRLLGQFHVYAKPDCPFYFVFRVEEGGINAVEVHEAIEQLFPELAAHEELARV